MNLQEKEQVVQLLKNNFQNSQASFLVGYKGMTVAEVTQLRRQLGSKGGSFKVAKVTLMKRVAHDIPTIEKLTPYFKDQVALIFAEQESPAIAKILCDFAQNNQQLHVIAGYLQDNILTADAVQLLANLPSKEVLLAQVCGSMKAPIAGFTHVLTMLMLGLIGVLKQLEEKKASKE